MGKGSYGKSMHTSLPLPHLLPFAALPSSPSFRFYRRTPLALRTNHDLPTNVTQPSNYPNLLFLRPFSGGLAEPSRHHTSFPRSGASRVAVANAELLCPPRAGTGVSMPAQALGIMLGDEESVKPLVLLPLSALVSIERLFVCVVCHVRLSARTFGGGKWDF
jgi:hypothetical protein